MFSGKLVIFGSIKEMKNLSLMAIKFFTEASLHLERDLLSLPFSQFPSERGRTKERT